MRQVWLWCLVVVVYSSPLANAQNSPKKTKKQRTLRKKRALHTQSSKRALLRWSHLKKLAQDKKTPPSKPQIPAAMRQFKLDPKETITKEPELKLPPLPPRFDLNQPQTPLSQLYQLARKVNLDLRILKERLVQAELIKAKTWAMLKPSLKLNGSFTRNQQAVTFNPTASLAGLAESLPEPIRSQILASTKNSSGVELTPLNQLAFSLQMQWAFFNLRAIPLLQIAYMSVDQVGQTAIQIKRDVMFQLARAYYGVLLADGLVDIYRRSLQNSKEHLRIAQARFQAGVAQSLVVTKAQLDEIKAQQSLIQSQNALRNAKLAIALLLNKPRFLFRPQKPSPPSLPPGSLNEWLQQAEANQPELKSAKIAVQIAEARVTETWLQFMPTIALSGNFQGTNAGGFAGQNTTWSITLAAQMSIYDGGTRYAILQESFSKRRQAKFEYLKARRKTQNEIFVAHLSLKNAKATLKVAKQQRVLAERSYNLTQERYRTGVATPVEVSDAISNLNTAQINVLRETLNLEVSILALQRAIGTFKAK